MADQLSLVLLVVPLVCLVFGTIHFYNSYDFIELLAAQPIKRHSILMGQYLGVAVPVLLYAASATGISSAAGILVLWAVLPVMLSLRIFRKKDL